LHAQTGPNPHVNTPHARAHTHARTRTQRTGTKVQGVWLSPSRPREVLFGLNRRARTSFDVYRAGAAGAAARAPTLDTVNPGDVTSWVVGPDALTVEVRACGRRVLRRARVCVRACVC
jgi:hypothetical protein